MGLALPVSSLAMPSGRACCHGAWLVSDFMSNGRQSCRTAGAEIRIGMTKSSAKHTTFCVKSRLRLSTLTPLAKGWVMDIEFHGIIPKYQAVPVRTNLKYSAKSPLFSRGIWPCGQGTFRATTKDASFSLNIDTVTPANSLRKRRAITLTTGSSVPLCPASMQDMPRIPAASAAW